MNCEKYLCLIDDLVEGELGQQISHEVRSHIFECPDCVLLYESLKQEKQMYARYLFAVEPSGDLWTKFQAKLESETKVVSGAAQTSANISFWKRLESEFWGWRTAPMVACLLVLAGLGFAFLNFAPFGKILESERVSRSASSSAESGAIQTAQTELSETFKTLSDSQATPIKGRDANFDSAGEVKNKFKAKLLQTESAVSAKSQTIKFREIKTKKDTIAATVSKELTDFERITKDERAQILQVKTLEKETVKQIGKIEMLLRSFRNARAAEGSEAFDVAYEKQQARKLLEKNAQLRRGAESLGTIYTDEILSKAEPHLLDIANLDQNPAPDKVLGIKERVKNQNIIASLQIY